MLEHLSPCPFDFVIERLDTTAGKLDDLIHGIRPQPLNAEAFFAAAL
jgi:hypothetical protein